MVKMVTVPFIEELDTRSMSLQTPLRSKHITAGTHAQVLIFSRASTMGRHFASSVRIESRGASGVGIDTASTTVHRSFNGNARRKSRSSQQVRLLATKRAERTVMDVDTLLDECPSRSRCGLIHATRPIWGHAP